MGKHGLGNVHVSSKTALISNDGLTLSHSPLLPLSPCSPLRQPPTPFRRKRHSITERMCIEKDATYCGRYKDFWRISKLLGGYKASWPLHHCHRAVTEHEQWADDPQSVHYQSQIFLQQWVFQRLYKLLPFFGVHWSKVAQNNTCRAPLTHVTTFRTVRRS